MPSTRTLCAALTAAILVFLVGPARAEEPAWRAGIARAKITPEEPLWLAGYAGRDHAAEGTLCDLWVKALALEDAEGRRGVVVTTDLLGFPREMSASICAAIQTRCGLERSQIMLTSSHTHTGPVLASALLDIYPLEAEQLAKIERYSKALEKTVADTAARALADMTPAVLEAGQGEAGFAVNRRNNREARVPEVRAEGEKLQGPSDHRVPVLAVRTPEGELRAVAFSYACHATTLSSYEWSGDWPGFAQLALEEEHPGVTALFHAGCGADQNPLPRRTVELCRKYGGEMAAAVDKVLAGPVETIAPTLRTAFEITDLSFGVQPTREELDKAAAGSGYRAQWARRLAADLEAGHAFATSYPYPVEVWRLGRDRWWIVLGGEVVVDYSLVLREKYGPKTWVTGYANDVMAYIPSRRVWEEGGYEAGAFSVYGLPADRWTPDIEERILASVQRLVTGLQP